MNHYTTNQFLLDCERTANAETQDELLRLYVALAAKTVEHPRAVTAEGVEVLKWISTRQGLDESARKSVENLFFAISLVIKPGYIAAMELLEQEAAQEIAIRQSGKPAPKPAPEKKSEAVRHAKTRPVEASAVKKAALVPAATHAKVSNVVRIPVVSRVTPPAAAKVGSAFDNYAFFKSRQGYLAILKEQNIHDINELAAVVYKHQYNKTFEFQLRDQKRTYMGFLMSALDGNKGSPVFSGLESCFKELSQRPERTANISPATQARAGAIAANG